MRNHMADDSWAEPADNVLSFRRPPDPTTDRGTAALELINQVADLIKNADDYAHERQTRAETLAKLAIEKLKIADARVDSAELNWRAAEAEIKTLKDRVENEFSIKVQELEKLMEGANSRVVAAEAQVLAAEQRAKAAEIRANKTENVLKRVEEALRTQILQQRSGVPDIMTAVAA